MVLTNKGVRKPQALGQKAAFSCLWLECSAYRHLIGRERGNSRPAGVDTKAALVRDFQSASVTIEPTLDKSVMWSYWPFCQVMVPSCVRLT